MQIHLSFSQLGGATDGDKSQTHIGGSFLSLLLQSVGVAVTEVQDVEFKWVIVWPLERYTDSFAKVTCMHANPCEDLSDILLYRCRLAYFEIKDKVYTQQQLIDVAVKHYTSQVNCIVINVSAQSTYNDWWSYLVSV